MQTYLLVKVGLCLMPLCGGLHAAAAVAKRRQMPRAARMWLTCAKLTVLVLAVCLLGQLLVLAMQ